MKIRQGFVSNSSTSSFMIMGKWLDDAPENLRELRNQGIRYYESDEDGPCIGLSFDIKDDETWGQYKDRVAKVLTTYGVPAEAKDIRLCTGTYPS